MSRIASKQEFGVSNHRSVQPQEMTRGSILRISEEEGLYSLCSENKGAYLLHFYGAADLRFLNLLIQKQVFS